MDKSWMTLIRDRLSSRYRAGVDAFIEFAKVNAGESSTIRCPCNKCMNLDWREFGIVQDHLVRYGIMVSYKTWLHHGEWPNNQHGDSGDDRDESEDDNRDEYPELLEDHCRGTYMDDEVVALKETVAMQAEQIASQAEQMNAQAEQMNAQAQKIADLEALVHQLFARSQPGASGGSRDFLSR